MNLTDKDMVSVNFVRMGIKKSANIKLENLQDRKINEMIVFGGAVFFESNDEVRFRSGVSDGVFVANVKEGSSFSEIFPAVLGNGKTLVKILDLAGSKINSLKDLKKILPELIKKENFHVRYKNYSVDVGHNQNTIFNQCEKIAPLSIYKSDSVPVIYIWNDKSKEWEVISIKQ